MYILMFISLIFLINWSILYFYIFDESEIIPKESTISINITPNEKFLDIAKKIDKNNEIYELFKDIKTIYIRSNEDYWWIIIKPKNNIKETKLYQELSGNKYIEKNWYYIFETTSGSLEYYNKTKLKNFKTSYPVYWEIDLKKIFEKTPELQQLKIKDKLERLIISQSYNNNKIETKIKIKTNFKLNPNLNEKNSILEENDIIWIWFSNIVKSLNIKNDDIIKLIKSISNEEIDAIITNEDINGIINSIENMYIKIYEIDWNIWWTIISKNNDLHKLFNKLIIFTKYLPEQDIKQIDINNKKWIEYMWIKIYSDFQDWNSKIYINWEKKEKWKIIDMKWNLVIYINSEKLENLLKNFWIKYYNLWKIFIEWKINKKDIEFNITNIINEN